MQCLFLAASVAGVVLIALRWNRCSQETKKKTGGVPLPPECTPLLQPKDERSEEIPVAVDAVTMVIPDKNQEISEHESVNSTESGESFETIFDPTSVCAAENGSAEEESMLWWVTGTGDQ